MSEFFYFRIIFFLINQIEKIYECVYLVLQFKNYFFIDNTKELAQKYYGIFKVAAVNCQEEDDICEDEFNVHRFPQVQCYSSQLKEEATVFKSDKYTIANLANFAVKKMENYVFFVSEGNYEDFIKQDYEKNKVLLFTN